MVQCVVPQTGHLRNHKSMYFPSSRENFVGEFRTSSIMQWTFCFSVFACLAFVRAVALEKDKPHSSNILSKAQEISSRTAGTFTDLNHSKYVAHHDCFVRSLIKLMLNLVQLDLSTQISMPAALMLQMLLNKLQFCTLKSQKLRSREDGRTRRW